MGKNRKRFFKRLTASLTAMVVTASTLLGCVPKSVQEVQAATTIGTWDKEKEFPYEYRFDVKFIEGITEAEPFGCDNQDVKAFTNNGAWPAQMVTKRMSGSYAAGSAGILYKNVGSIGDQIVDFKMSVTSVDGAETRYDLDRAYGLYTGKDASEIHDWPDNLAQPVVAFSLDTIGLRMECIDTINVKFEFFKHGTNEPLVINGHGTFADLDSMQQVRFPDNSNIDNAYILKGNNFLDVQGQTIVSADDTITPANKNGWVTWLYQASELNFEFGVPKKYDVWDEQRDEQIAKHGSQEAWAKWAIQHYADDSGKSYCENYDGGKYTRGQAFFEFTSYALGDFNLKEYVEKRVGDVGVSWLDASQTPKDHPYKIYSYEEFDYLIQNELTPNHLSEYVMEDTLKECLTIDNANKVTITNSHGQDVSSQFDIKIDGQTVTCRAKEKYLKEEAFTNNETYTFRLRVHRKEGGDVHDFLQENKYIFDVPNTAIIRYARENGKGETTESNEVWVQGRVIPNLIIDKTSSKYEWEVGDSVDYTVKVTQKKPHAWAINTVVKDISIPAGLKVLDYDVQTSGEEHSQIKKDGSNGWIATCPLLQYDESIIVTFHCEATEDVNGMETVNTATVTADNFMDEKSEELKEAKDIEEIWVNTPHLTVDKTADHYEWQVGDQVAYKVIVNNAKDYTIAKDLVISDVSLPEGLKLQEGADAVSVSGIPESVNYPVADNLTGMATKTIPVESSLERDGNGWIVKANYLPSNTPVTITFNCEATEAVNGRENVNEANAVATNAEGVSDDAEAYVNTAVFDIDKTADHYEWEVDEDVIYKIVVTNTFEGTIARNVTIWDTDLPDGLALNDDADAITIEGVPATFPNKVAGTKDIPSQTDPDHYNETVEKEIAQELLREGNGFRLNLSDLPYDTPVTITLKCKATEEVNGKESVNEANVQAENGELVQDDAEVYVNTAILTMDKEVINAYYTGQDSRLDHEFRVGETVQYKVTVNNTQPGSIARNLVISDTSLPEGLKLNEGEDAIKVEGIPDTFLNPVGGTDDAGNQLDPENYNETEEKAIERSLDREGTGWKLSVSDLPYNTPVTITFNCTATEAVNGWEVVNTAKAAADNASEVKDSEKVWINSPNLVIDKKADKEVYSFNDIGTYHIDLKNDQIGTVARNVIISDVIQTPGVHLQKDSISLMRETADGKKEKIEAQIDVVDNSFVIHTGRALVKEGFYHIWDTENGGDVEQVIWNPLDLKEETRFYVEYQVAFVDHALAGQEVHNIATGNSDENIPKEDEEIIKVNAPELDIVKESDKKEYKIGEVGQYKLTIRQIRENVEAINVEVRDELQIEGVKLVPQSILVKLNGQLVTDAKITEGEKNFVIQTGKNMKDEDKLEIYYNVLFEDVDLNEKDVVNIAWAKADNTDEETQDYSVKVRDIIPYLSIEKTSDKEYYSPGDIGHYTVKVTQTEKDAVARNVMIKDDLMTKGGTIVPKSVKFSDKKGLDITRAVSIKETETGYYIMTGKDLGYKETFTVTYDVEFNKSILEVDALINLAKAKADNTGLTAADDAAFVDVGHGLKAMKTSNPASNTMVEAGDEIVYSIVVNNPTKEPIKHILVRDQLSDHLDYVEGGELRTIFDQAYVTFVIDELAAGASQTLNFKATVKEDADEDAFILNVAEVGCAPSKEDIHDFWDYDDVFGYTNDTMHTLDRWVVTKHEVYPTKDLLPEEPKKADFTITKSADKSQAKPKDEILYTIVVKNTGEADLTDVKVKDVFTDSSIKAAFDETSGATLNAVRDEAVIASLKVRESFTLTAKAVIPENYEKEELTNTVTATAIDPESKEELKREDDAKVILPKEDPKDPEPTEKKADVVIEKTADKYSVEPKDEVTYTIEVKNPSDVDLTDVKVTDKFDNLSYKIKFEESKEEGVTVAANKESVTIATLKAGESIDLKGTFTVPATAKGEITNTAIVTAKDPDGNSLTAEDDATIKLEEEEDKATEKDDPDDDKKKSSNPVKTGDDNQLPVMGAVILGLLILAVCIFFIRKKIKKGIHK